MIPPSAIDGQSLVYGILGHPVAHSLSPAMHNAAFRALGLNAVYVPFPVAPERLAEAVAGLLAVGVRGFNLTVPHKTAMIPLLAEVMPEARSVGAVNTVRCEEGRLIGANTDGPGFLLSLEHDLGFDPGGKTVLMLGAGGAARGIAFALLGAGCERLILANRTAAKAETLAAECGAQYPGQRIDCSALDSLAGLKPHLLVQATSAGMAGSGGEGILPVDPEPVGVREALVDIVYHPLETPLLAAAGRLGLPRANGLGMLLYQGVAAFRFWSGREPPVPAMRAALLEAMKEEGDGESG